MEKFWEHLIEEAKGRNYGKNMGTYLMCGYFSNLMPHFNRWNCDFFQDIQLYLQLTFRTLLLQL